MSVKIEPGADINPRSGKGFNGKFRIKTEIPDQEKNSQHTIYFGDEEAPTYRVHGDEAMSVRAPQAEPGTSKEVFLVRNDGHLVVPTGLWCSYSTP